MRKRKPLLLASQFGKKTRKHSEDVSQKAIEKTRDIARTSAKEHSPPLFQAS